MTLYKYRVVDEHNGRVYVIYAKSEEEALERIRIKGNYFTTLRLHIEGDIEEVLDKHEEGD